MREEEKYRYHPEPTAPQQRYGTFQGGPGYPPPQPAIGFPQPVSLPGAVFPSAAGGPAYYPHGYQAVPGSILICWKSGQSPTSMDSLIFSGSFNLMVLRLKCKASFFFMLFVVVQVYVTVAEGRPVRERPLSCCGFGMGWFLFIIGFFLAAIPWYVGAFVLLFTMVDYREKPGYVACTIAAVLAAIATIAGATKGADVW